MTRLMFDAPNCQGVTSGATGRNYDADRKGFITVNDPADIKALKAGGYLEAGGMPHLSKYWLCKDCDWEAALNHCRWCGSEELTRMESA